MRKTWVVIGLLLLWLAAPAQQSDSARQDSSAVQTLPKPKPHRQKPVAVRQQPVSTSQQRDSILKQPDSTVQHSDTLFQKPIVTDTPKMVKPAFSLFLDSSVYNHQPYCSATHPLTPLI